MQKYSLGQKVWAFKQQGQALVKAFGVIQQVELDKSGYIFYKVLTGKMDEKGQLQTALLTANHASLAETEAELDVKIAEYATFQEAQKKVFEEKFGKPEFAPDAVEALLAEGV